MLIYWEKKNYCNEEKVGYISRLLRRLVQNETYKEYEYVSLCQRTGLNQDIKIIHFFKCRQVNTSEKSSKKTQ